MLSDPPAGVDHDVFVVHADDDTPFVKGELLPMLGLPDDRVILSSELPFPAFTEQAIADSVRRSRLTLAVLSPAYLRDRWAGFAELLSRNENAEAADGGTLVPLLVADCEVPAVLAQHAMLDCRSQAQRELTASRLRQRLGRPAPPSQPIACPYPGMRPFSAETAAQFHGRTREIDELVGRLEAGEREIYVIGPSGSGKSSLVAAGVIPRVQRADRDEVRLAVRTLRPGEHPTRRLAEALGCEASSLDRGTSALLEREACHRLLVFVDQLEELFALADAQDRQDFVRALRMLRADRRCHLVVALRADFYGALMSSELWPDIDGRFTRLEVAPLRGAALREAIEAPAREAGVYLEGALVERLMSDAAAEPGALPLLQEALVLLWRRRSHRLLRLASYDELGSDGRSGLAVALARRADAILHDFTPPRRLLAQRIFLRLVSFGEGRPDTRRQQPRAALSASGENPGDADAVIDRLIDERMLTSDATPGGEPLVDLSHEALIAGWPEFQRWLLSRRDDEQRRRLLELHVAEWIKRGGGAAGLFDAVELAEAERWIAGESARELGYSDDLPRFLAASSDAIEEAKRQKRLALELQDRERRAAQTAIDEAERQKLLALEQQERERRAAKDESVRLRRRLARFAIAILSLFSIVASVLGLAAWHQRQVVQRQFGVHEQDQARSLLVEGHDPIAAVPHLLQAANLAPDSQVLRTLLAEVTRGMWRTAVRHSEPVRTAAFSPDGTRIVTADSAGVARVWDATTGAPLGASVVPGEAIHSAAFSPDGTRVVTASADGRARVWDAATGAPVGVPLVHEQAVSSAAFSPDGTRVVTASWDGTAHVWDAATGAPLGVPLVHLFAVNSAAFNPDGTQVVTAGNDGTARIWDAATGALRSVLQDHEQAVQGAAFSPDGTRVVTASNDGTARIWDAATGAPLGPPLKHDRAVSSAAFSPDGTRVVTASEDGTARVWDAATGAALGVPFKHERKLSSAMFSPDGTRVVTTSEDGTARIWDAVTGAALGVPLQHEQGVNSGAFSPDGTRIVTASDDGTARVWDAPTIAPFGFLLQHEQGVNSAMFSPDGTRVVTASDDGTARVWSAATGASLAVPLEHAHAVRSAAFSSDGTRVVTACDAHRDVFERRSVRVWDAATGAPVDDAVHTTGVPFPIRLPIELQTVICGAFHRDSAGLAQGWSSAPAAPLRSPATHLQTLNCAEFSRDGTRIVTASKDHTARVWDAATGAAVGVPLTHDAEVTSAAFSPDGSLVVTASVDGTARLWDAATGAPLGAPLRHKLAVHSAAFSPDGTRVITASADGTAQLWNVVETGALSAWRDQATSCAIPDSDGSHGVCPLSDHEASPSELRSRVRSLIAAGDLTLFSEVVSLARAHYQQAVMVLDDTRDSWSRTNDRDIERLRRAVALRLAILDATVGHMEEARKHLQPDAPNGAALLLNTLGTGAHEELENDPVALRLLLRAHELDPQDPSILANLAEVYFAAGRHDDFARAADMVNELPPVPHIQVCLSGLAWAAARVRGVRDAAQAMQLLGAYNAIPNGARIGWTWGGTKHALTYGRIRFVDAKPILDVLALLEEPVTDETRAKLAELLQAHQPTRTEPK